MDCFPFEPEGIAMNLHDGESIWFKVSGGKISVDWTEITEGLPSDAPANRRA